MGWMLYISDEVLHFSEVLGEKGKGKFTECLAGRLTGAQSQVSEDRRSWGCGVLLRGVNG